MVNGGNEQLSLKLYSAWESIQLFTFYCVLSANQTLFVSNPSGATGLDVCFRACPVSRWSLSIIISSQESI